jgi:ribose transport system ATP-binding protein
MTTERSAHATPGLYVSGLTKTFGGTRALSHVSIEVRPGEVHALVGQNGSGKSTLIKILAGYHQPDPGAAATLAGRSFALGDSSAAYQAGLRFVHQDLGVVGALSTVENLALGHGYRTAGLRIDWPHHIREARRAISALGHDFEVLTPLDELSVVQRTVVAIARALQTDDGIEPSVLVLDEPTSAMPAPEVERLLDLVAAVRHRGTSVLYVSHRLGEIFRVADRVTVLRDGVASEPREVSGLDRSEVIELMTGTIAAKRDPSPARGLGETVLLLNSVSGGTVVSMSLAVRRQEIVGVAGIAGSGREDLCDLLFGGRHRTGSVEVDGRLVPADRPDQAMRLGMALVPADRLRFGLVRSLSVRENLTLPSISRFVSVIVIRRASERRDATTWFERLGIKAAGLEAGVDTLSGGNQQKVVLAKCLMVAPAVLLLDEPTQGVDVAAKAEIHEQIGSFARNGGAVLVCSSDAEELERLCDRVVILRKGRVAMELTGPDLTVRRLTHEVLVGEQRPVADTSALPTCKVTR